MTNTKKFYCSKRTIQNLSAHLDQLAGKIHLVEEALGETLVGQTAFTGAPMTTLQSLDFTRQSLEDCALLLHLMSNSKCKCPEASMRPEQSMKLKLSTTRNLLGDRKLSAEQLKNGEIDLF